MRVVCFSDVHGMFERMEVPEGDVLIMAGDCTARNSIGEHLAFLDWLGRLRHKEKLLVAGNHDGCWADLAWSHALRTAAKARGISYVQHEGGRLRGSGLKVWGSPWTPAFQNWHFMYPRGGPEATELWASLPDGLDVLVTHGPPAGVLDTVSDEGSVGCEALAERLGALRAPPRLHVFGHIHEAGGRLDGETISVNASVLNERYELVREPVVVDLQGPAR